MNKFFIGVVFIFVAFAFINLTPFEKKILPNFIALLRDTPQEKLYLHTDKEVYIAGEKIWFRAYLVHAAIHVPFVRSRFIYVDLVDQRDSLVSRVKIMERDSCFEGYFPIPENIQQGDYCLRAFTYAMQNGGDDYFFKKSIRVIDPQYAKVRTRVSYERRGKNNYIASIRFSDRVGNPFEKTLVAYRLNAGDSRSEKVVVTDRDGSIEVKIDSSVNVISLRFAGNNLSEFVRNIYIPKFLTDFDVQFFPEGGTLLAGNWQKIAFKAIGRDGLALDVSGEIYRDSLLVAEFVSQHDGMGCFRLPVVTDAVYRAKVKTKSGEEKFFDLPSVVSTGIGLTLEQRDSVVNYRIIKGAEALLPEDLYVVLHCRGNILGVTPVTNWVLGKIHRRILPEGINHLLLMDARYNVYSQRLFFEKKKKRPEIRITSAQNSYKTRDLIRLEVGFEDDLKGRLEGSFSVAVTDDQQVVHDSMAVNILSGLLLTSDLKGYIENPSYYFKDSSDVLDEHLDLVMLTHGWTRFDVAKIAKGEFPDNPFELEVGQVVSGKVNNFWGGHSKGADIILISNYGLFRTAKTDEEGRFLIDGIAFRDSTQFVVQGISAKGRRTVSVHIDKDHFLPTRYTLPDVGKWEKDTNSPFGKYGLDFYYLNGEKVYILDEVMIARRPKKERYSIYDDFSSQQLDSAKIAESGFQDILRVIETLPGITVSEDEKGNPVFKRFGKKLYVLVNDFEEDFDFISLIPVQAIKNISVLDPTQARIFFGGSAADGALIISIDRGYMPKDLGRPDIIPFTLLGFQIPEKFYVPKYDVDFGHRTSEYDGRSTIYWNPVVKVDKKGSTSLSFPAADIPGTYSVIIEGVTADGRLCRKRMTLVVE